MLSNRYITDRFLPDKAIDLMDEAASRLRMQVDSKPEELDEIDRRVVEQLQRSLDRATDRLVEEAERRFDVQVRQSREETAARLARLEERIRVSDLVITGEGAIDTSTLMGKGVGEVAMLCHRHGVPCLGLAGTKVPWSEADEARKPFSRVRGIAPELASAEEAKSRPELWLPRLAKAMAEEWTAARG